MPAGGRLLAERCFYIPTTGALARRGRFNLTKDFAHDASFTAFSHFLRRYFVPHRPRAVAVGVLLLAGSFLQLLLTPQIARPFIDTAQLGGAMGTLVLAAGLFLLVALLSQAVTVVETYLAESLGWAATNTLRADLAEHVLELDLSFHNAHTPGELLERVRRRRYRARRISFRALCCRYWAVPSC